MKSLFRYSDVDNLWGTDSKELQEPSFLSRSLLMQASQKQQVKKRPNQGRHWVVHDRASSLLKSTESFKTEAHPLQAVLLGSGPERNSNRLGNHESLRSRQIRLQNAPAACNSVVQAKSQLFSKPHPPIHPWNQISSQKFVKTELKRSWSATYRYCSPFCRPGGIPVSPPLPWETPS